MPDPRADKVTDLAAAIARHVADGCHLSIGGFTVNRNPMAAVYEIIRQKKRDLHLYAHSNGQGVDELIGAGCVARVEIAYGGSGRFAPTCARFARAVERNEIQVEDYTNYQMTLRFMAGAMGVPFLPTRSALSTDIVERWGFSAQLRKQDARLPKQKLCVLENPFEGWGDTERVVLVPAIQPDVTIIHAQKADRVGNVRIAGLTFADVEQAKAAEMLIVTCEELVDEAFLRENPDLNQIPFFCVDAVVPLRFGAYPCACYRCYDYDPVYLNAYRSAAGDDEKHAQYLKQNIHAFADHAGFVRHHAGARIDTLKADSRTGYAVGLDRR
jgi:glutaconate CoA-transferase subunit A